MRIAILTAQDPDSVGGVERFASLLRRALESQGAVVETFWPTNRHGSRTSGRLGLDEYLAARKLRKKVVASRFDPDLAIGNGTYAAAAPRRRHGIAVHHGIYAALADACRPGLSMRAYARTRYLKAFWEVHAGKGLLRVAVSASTAAELRRYHGVEGVEVIENAVDLAHFAPKPPLPSRNRYAFRPDNRYILFASRVEYRKGVDIIGTLAPRLRPREKLVIASTGELDLPNTVNIGPVDYQQLPTLLAAVDLYLLPTRYEGWSYGLLEAMAAARPFVTTAVGGARDLEGETELALGLARSTDSDVHLAAVRRLLDDGAAAEQLGRAARAYVEKHHDVASWSARWASVIERAMRSKC